jgi:hypothetical protein
MKKYHPIVAVFLIAFASLWCYNHHEENRDTKNVNTHLDVTTTAIQDDSPGFILPSATFLEHQTPIVLDKTRTSGLQSTDTYSDSTITNDSLRLRRALLRLHGENASGGGGANTSHIACSCAACTKQKFLEIGTKHAPPTPT